MLRTRVMPCLLLKGNGLVKTVRYKQPNYVGDPVNTIRIFNELEVDELILLDIDASVSGCGIQYDILEDVASECFMPLTYGGGIRHIEDAEKLFSLGIEKCVINTCSLECENIVGRIARLFGSQSVVVSIDVRRTLFNSYRVFSKGGTVKHRHSPVDWARRVEDTGAGEIILTSIDREGTFSGYDLELIRAVSEAVTIPVIAHGGASCVEDFCRAVFEGKASAVAAGSMFVYQGKNRAVVTNFPSRKTLREALRQ